MCSSQLSISSHDCERAGGQEGRQAGRYSQSDRQPASHARRHAYAFCIHPGKSTAVHAAVIAPADTTVRLWPDIPDYDANKTLLVFPGDSAVTLAQLAKDFEEEEEEEKEVEEVNEKSEDDNDVENKRTMTNVESNPPAPTNGATKSEPLRKKARRALPYDTIVFIESTWNQAHSIFIDERLQRLKRIQLHDYETHFWR